MKSDLKEENINLIKLGVYKKDIVDSVKNLDLDNKYFLFVGRLIKEKDFLGLLKIYFLNFKL